MSKPMPKVLHEDKLSEIQKKVLGTSISDFLMEEAMPPETSIELQQALVCSREIIVGLSLPWFLPDIWEWWQIRKLGSFKKNMTRALEHCPVELLYYPGSGSDRIPRKILGADRVIHLNREDLGDRDFHPLPNDGIIDMVLEADFRRSPLHTHSVDAILIKHLPLGHYIEALPDFDRVLKNDGYLFFFPVLDILDELYVFEGLREAGYTPAFQNGLLTVFKKTNRRWHRCRVSHLHF